MSGAPALAALAALPRAARASSGSACPRASTRPSPAHAPGAHGARRARRRARARAGGPRRRGRRRPGPRARARGDRELVDALVRGVEAPLVLDADALFALAGRLETLARARRADGAHAACRRARAPARARQRRDRRARGSRASARRRSARGAAVLLKGPDTLVAAPGEPLRVVETAVPQLATAGAGDVLAGAVGALCARGLPPARGARAGRASRTARRPAWRSPRPARSSPPTCCCRSGGCSRDALDARDRSRRRARRTSAELIEAAGGSRLWAVVKADGYGHGAVECAGDGALGGRRARVLRDARGGARAARRRSERARRSSCSRRSSPARRRGAGGFEIVVSSLEDYARLRAAGVACGVHVKADTGMGRWGMAPADALAVGTRARRRRRPAAAGRR